MTIYALPEKSIARIGVIDIKKTQITKNIFFIKSPLSLYDKGDYKSPYDMISYYFSKD